MKFRGFRQAIVVGIAALLMAVGGLGSGQNRAAQASTLAPARTTPEAIAFIPERTIAFGTLLLDASDWEAAQLEAVPSRQRRQFRRRLTDLKRGLRRFGIRYDRDIKPWIGSETTVALVSRDEDRNPDNGQQPGYLAAIATDDAEASIAFLERVWRRRASQTIGQAGIEVTYLPQPSGGGLATAQVGERFVLLASHLSVLQDAISSAQVPSLNVRARPQYRAAIAQIPSQAIGFILGAPKVLARYLPSSLQLWPLQAAEPGAAEIQLLASATLSEPGILIQAGPHLDNGSSLVAASTDEAAAPQLAALARWFPPTSTAVILDRDLDARWSEALIKADTAGTAAILAAIAPDDIDALGADIQDIRDWVVPWVNQPYAVAKLPKLEGRDQPDWLFATPMDDAVEAGLADLDQRAQSQGLTVGRIPYAKQTLTVWTALSAGVPADEPGGDIPALIAEVKGVHTVVEDTVLLATSIGAVAQALQAAEVDGISPLVEALGPSSSYLRLDGSQVPKRLAEATGDRRLADWAEPLQGIVEAVTLTQQGADSGPSTVRLLLEVAGDPR